MKTSWILVFWKDAVLNASPKDIAFPDSAPLMAKLPSFKSRSPAFRSLGRLPLISRLLRKSRPYSVSKELILDFISLELANLVLAEPNGALLSNLLKIFGLIIPVNWRFLFVGIPTELISAFNSLEKFCVDAEATRFIPALKSIP